MCISFYQYFPKYLNKKVVRVRLNCPGIFEEWIFLDIFYVFIDEVVMKIFISFLITNPLLYESIVNLFEHNMVT